MFDKTNKKELNSGREILAELETLVTLSEKIRLIENGSPIFKVYDMLTQWKGELPEKIKSVSGTIEYEKIVERYDELSRNLSDLDFEKALERYNEVSQELMRLKELFRK